jgi:hypothetical protein
MNTRAQRILERPVSFVTATQKLADIKGYLSAGGWIRRDWGSGPTICLGWEALGHIFVNDGLLLQDTDRGKGKWYVRIDGLTEAELEEVERIWPPRMCRHRGEGVPQVVEAQRRGQPGGITRRLERPPLHVAMPERGAGLVPGVLGMALLLMPKLSAGCAKRRSQTLAPPRSSCAGCSGRNLLWRRRASTSSRCPKHSWSAYTPAW